jgi:predicted PurR-regulated permease PerM
MPLKHSNSAPANGKSLLESLALWALVVLAIGAIGVILHLAQSAFMPVAFSLVFALVLSSPTEFLCRVGMPRTLAAVLVLVVLIALAGVLFGAVWAPARAWASAIPHTIEIIERKLGPAARVLEHVVGGVNQESASSSANRTVEFAMTASATLLGQAPAFAVNVLTIVILTLFLLAGGAPMTARVAATLTSEGKSVKVLTIVGAMRREIARYYATIAVINLGLGAATAAVMALLSLPNPLLWGATATALNFIPYAGSAVTLVILTVVSFVTFDSLGHVFAVATSFLILVTIEGQIIEPLLIGRRLKLSPTIVFLCLWFGGWFWGIAGIILAIPALVALKVVAEQSKSKNGRILFELLSPSSRKKSQFVPPKIHRAHSSDEPDVTT